MTHVVIATPTPGDSVSASYHAAVWTLMRDERCSRMQVSTILMHADLEEARSEMARVFLADFPDATHLLFWDSDVCGDAAACLDGMLALEVDCVGCTYPKKWIHWGRMSGESEHEAAAYDYAYRSDPHAVVVPNASTVRAIGAGFLLISRRLLERIPPRCELLFEKRWSSQGGKRVRLPEDYSFCERVRECGAHVWMYTGPGAPLNHVGHHVFRGHRSAVVVD